MMESGTLGPVGSTGPRVSVVAGDPALGSKGVHVCGSVEPGRVGVDT